MLSRLASSKKEHDMTTHNEQHSKNHNKQYSDNSSGKARGKLTNPQTSVRSALPAFSALLTLRMLAVLVLGSVALALSCAPATSAPVDGGGVSNPSAPSVPTDITIDKANTESSSFTVQWVASTSTGTGSDGTALTPTEVGYRIYYLAGTADEEKPSAESVRQNTDTQILEPTGSSEEVASAKITGLEPATRYFVTIASFNTLAPLLAETVSSEVVATTTSAPADFDFAGDLAYRTEEYSYVFGFSTQTISPNTNTLSASNGVQINYSLEKQSGTNFILASSTTGNEAAVSINASNGKITVDPTQNVGTAIYLVRASAEGHNEKNAILTITIVENTNTDIDMLQASTYYSSEATDMLPVGLGQALADVGMFSMPNDRLVLIVSNLLDGIYTVHFGIETDNYNSGSYSKTASGGIIIILKSELATNSFPFTDGAVIGISGPGLTDTEPVAMYVPSNIYTHYDLQAMRRDTARDYLLMNDIEFPPTAAGASNYVAIGDGNFPFTGSLNGANVNEPGSSHSITGLQIDDPGFSAQGIFGEMVGQESSTVVAQHLILRDFKLKGRDLVGPLSGWIRKGTVNNVHVEVSAPDAGYVMGNSFIGGVIGGISSFNHISGSSMANVTGNYDIGGLAGSSGGTVMGFATGSVTGTLGRIGGLVGKNEGGTIRGFATGPVLGEYHTGGLVGYHNYGSVSGYATGTVTGTGDGVGGLVGYNNYGTVRGYATGVVMGNNEVGGLVGQQGADGAVSGYATGPVTGNRKVGGLVGSIREMAKFVRGTAIGYATGLVTGNDEVGGLVGYNYYTTRVDSSVVGYARNIVRRSDGATSLFFGKTIGRNLGLKKTYSSLGSSAGGSSGASEVESQIYDGTTGTIALAGTTGINGSAVDVASAMQTTFEGFTFGTELGQWTWVDGKWPAINIGDELKVAAEQPIDLVAR